MTHCSGREFVDEDAAYEHFRQPEIDDTAEAERNVKDADWWADKLGSMDLGKDVASALARCMTNLDAACNGEPISRDAVLTALSVLQKQARLDAKDMV